ncbi:MAG: double-strand break repair protein AddB [Tranquillimonas sp.]
MFEPAPGARLFGLPPGADFPAELVAGLLARMEGQPPEALARVEIFVNTRRMQRRIRDLLSADRPRLLPRLRLVSELGQDAAVAGAVPPDPPLRRKLEVAQLVARLLDRDPTLAPRSAVYELADSLLDLMEEMSGEGVPPEALFSLDVSDQSAHWARSLAFIRVVQGYFDADAAPDAEGARRRAIAALAGLWTDRPPDHPVIVAGSTGSRGATALFMQAVARLPQGAVILPGYDFQMPGPVWARLGDGAGAEDHPQYRFAHLLRRLDLTPDRVARWTDRDPVQRRNALVSLALRPAPVTDQWLTEGRRMPDLVEATEGLSLVEAPDPRREALAIALCLREAAEAGRTAALITPDRSLSRQVAAALDRWRILPDDSAGQPAGRSAPGRFLRHLADLTERRLQAEDLLTLLKHPICNSGSGERGPHLLLTRELELALRRNGPAFPEAADLLAWAARRREPGATAWADWLAQALFPLMSVTGPLPLSDRIARHLTAAEQLAAGPGVEGSGQLWDRAAGEAVHRLVTGLAAEAGHGGRMTAADYRDLLTAILAGDEVREPSLAHPGIMIWGTLEARVQGAETVILGGLNEGTWPELPAPDPWLNRRMRQQAGLLLPERKVGLSAHDFQQAVAAPRVVLVRARRDGEAETVMSRWLNRLTNLLDGLPDQDGPRALAAMRQRGAAWLDAARLLEERYAPQDPAPRPAPRPPAAARPKRLSVTRIQTLIRDPYAIYAREILRLRPLDPLRPEPDAPLRGTVLHEIFDRVLRDGTPPDRPEARDRLLAIARAVLDECVPWPAARHVWFARVERVADWFLAGEVQRRAAAHPQAVEERGEYRLPGMDFVLTAKADRIDLRGDGRLVVYDYKTGTPPTAKVMRHFDKQLLLEAAMAEAGAFRGVPAAPVAEVAHIGLGSVPQVAGLTLRDPAADPPVDPDRVVQELRRLLSAYADPGKGYPARRAMAGMRHSGDYDHLARFGEWDDSQPALEIDVGRHDEL